MNSNKLWFYINLIYQTNTPMAMTALRIGAPKDYMRLLEDHADIVNLPRVGVDSNVAFPAVQANVAPAVAFDDALGTQNITHNIHCMLYTYSYFR
jgi:hypothetical protein